MKKTIKKKWFTREELELEQLRHWKYTSTKAKVQWLDEAFRFAKAKKS